MGNIAFGFPDGVVAVTGAASGIGRAVAREFGRAGAKVFLLDVDEEAGQRVSTEIDRAVFLRCDVTSVDSVRETFSRIETDSGHLDVLVNNAGGFSVKRTTDDLPIEEWYRVIDLNLNAVFLTAKHSTPLLRRSKAGRIINIGSLAGQVAWTNASPAYVAAKAGVHSLTRVLATELASDRITVNTLAPSTVATDRITQLRDRDEREEVVRSVPLGRYQEPEEVAWWVLFLASEEAGFATGQTIGINGGRHMT